MRRRELIVGCTALAVTHIAQAAMPEPSPNPRTVVTTELGRFVVEVYERQAPITAKNYLAYVDGGYLNGSTVYRIVAPRNQPNDLKHKIAVVQWGADPLDPSRSPFPPIPHEDTRMTGLKHVDGTISMARLAPGTASSAFFICIGDQPELDFGGHRNPDGQGFAAFGQVVEGMDVVRAIYARAESEGVLKHPIAISRVERAG
jgi:peptidyl-prolyl cis-trans isomerase A (cyclophilin A)